MTTVAKWPNLARWAMRRQARRRAAALVDGLPLGEHVIFACSAMHTLNRYAKHADESDKYLIYALKRRMIGELIEAGYRFTATRHVQRFNCYGCYGTGTYRSEYSDYEDWCYRCRGTGIHHEVELLLFTFTIWDTEYRWHQPRDFWPHVEIDGKNALYEKGDDKWQPLEALDLETKLTVIANWIDAQGLGLADPVMPNRDPSLVACIRGDLRWLKRRIAYRLRMIGYRWQDGWRPLRERLMPEPVVRPLFARHRSDDDDDLPF